MRRYPGFDILRIVAASAVVFSHSFLIAEGSEANEPFQMAFGEILGVYGVMVFFILSGYLISDSAIRTPSLWQFTQKRVRRIVPGFLICNLAVVVFVCSAFALAGPWNFLTEKNTWQQLVAVLGLQQDSLYYPDALKFYVGVGESDAWLPSVANGVLWTIRLEITCYVMVGLLSFFKAVRATPVLILICCSAAAAFYYPIQINGFISGFFFLLPSFTIGMVLRLFASNHKAEGRIALASISILVIIGLELPDWIKLEAVFFPLFAAYPLLWIGEQDNAIIQWIRGFGDPSYGMYLWGWPIQQVLRDSIGPNWSGYSFFLLCLPAVLFAGYASWYFVERPFVKRRRREILSTP